MSRLGYDVTRYQYVLAYRSSHKISVRNLPSQLPEIRHHPKTTYSGVWFDVSSLITVDCSSQYQTTLRSVLVKA